MSGGGPPAGSVPGQRAAATVSVPESNRAPLTPGDAVPLTPRSQVYQTAAGAPQPMQPHLPTRTPGEHAPPGDAGADAPDETAQPPSGQFGDPQFGEPQVGEPQFGEPSPGAQAYGQHPFGQPPRQREPGPPTGGAPGHPQGYQGQQAQGHASAGGPAPDPVGMLPDSPADPAAPPAGPPADRGAFAPPSPTGASAEAPAGAGESAAKSGPSTIVIIGAAMFGAAVLVLGALSIPYLLQQLAGGAPDQSAYSVGDCVVRDGTDARVTGCDQEGAFEIVSEAETREGCGDPTQPAIEVDSPEHRFYCLAPPGGAPSEGANGDSNNSDGDSDSSSDGDSGSDGDSDGSDGE